MALIQCKECQQAVSSTARRCPHCGASQTLTPWLWPVILGFVIVAILGGWFLYDAAQKADEYNRLQNSFNH